MASHRADNWEINWFSLITCSYLLLQLINEVVMLIRILHQNAVGKDVNLKETFGEYECTKVPQALFESNGSMRHCCKA